jgi:hypothetical protein
MNKYKGKFFIFNIYAQMFIATNIDLIEKNIKVWLIKLYSIGLDDDKWSKFLEVSSTKFVPRLDKWH